MMLKRRKFVKTSTWATTGLCCGMLGLPSSCTPVQYLDATIEDQTMSVEKSLWIEGDFVLVRNSRLPAPVYLRKDGQNYTALLLECTHKKCEVRPGTEVLKCPCHGSEFNNGGKVLNGPAEKDLIRFETWHDQTHIFLK